MNFMSGQLRDDGTEGTVIACPNCSEERRFNYKETLGEEEISYEEFLSYAIKNFNEDHECEAVS